MPTGSFTVWVDIQTQSYAIELHTNKRYTLVTFWPMHTKKMEYLKCHYYCISSALYLSM